MEVQKSAGSSISENGVGRLRGHGLHRRRVLGQDEPMGDTTVERSMPPAEIRLLVAVELKQLRGSERPAVPDQRLVEVAVVHAAVLTDRHREVGEPDAAESVAVLVAPDRGWDGRLEFKTRLQRWRRSTIEPHVEVAQRSAVRGCIAQDIPVLPYARPSSAAAGHERDAVTREERC